MLCKPKICRKTGRRIYSNSELHKNGTLFASEMIYKKGKNKAMQNFINK